MGKKIKKKKKQNIQTPKNDFNSSDNDLLLWVEETGSIKY